MGDNTRFPILGAAETALAEAASDVIDWDEAAGRLVAAIESAPWWIGQSGDLVVYRGFDAPREESTPVRFAAPRPDRRPMDTSIGWHNLLDQFFAKRFGNKFRSNALFCTGNTAVASYYGTLHIMIPMGNGQFIWSPDVDDLANSVSALLPPPPDLKELTGDGFEGTYINHNLVDAIHSEHEIMVNCRRAALFNAELDVQQLQALTASLRAFDHNLTPSSTSAELYIKLIHSIYD